MFARVFRDRDRVASSRTHTGNLVRCHRAAYASAIDNNTEITGTIGNCSSNSMCEVWIINCSFRVSAKVLNPVSELTQKNFELPFHLKAPVITSHCDYLCSL